MSKQDAVIKKAKAAAKAVGAKYPSEELRVKPGYKRATPAEAAKRADAKRRKGASKYK